MDERDRFPQSVRHGVRYMSDADTKHANLGPGSAPISVGDLTAAGTSLSAEAAASPSCFVPGPSSDQARSTKDNGRVCIIRAPGGLPGIEIHAGAWLAFEEAGIHPASLAGASAGAIVSAIQAYSGSPDAGIKSAADFVEFVRELRTEDLIRHRFAWKARAFWVTDFCDPAPIEKMLEQLLPLSFDQLSTKLLISATAMHSDPADCAYFGSGRCLRQAVRASSSIAGVWPYARIGGFDYTDGGTTDPFPQPWDIGLADRVFVINPVRKCNFNERDKNMISRLLWNVEQLQDSQAEDAKRDLAEKVKDRLHWLDIDMGDVSCLEFSANHELIDLAYNQTKIWLRGEKI